jgi:uncharacterized membrane protein YjgN (DUF898 family)
MTEPSFEGPATQPPTDHRLDIRFSGSGSEYFRIWIVNLLLTLVTLGIYYPWAKVRRMRYFYGNTLVGSHPLGFHADPAKMLRGYLLVALMLVLYSVSGHFSPLAGLVAFAIVAAIWPALLHSSMRFRLANTSWRGLRFRFRGSVQGAYATLLPLFVPGLLFVAALVGVPDPEHPPEWYGLLALAVTGAALVLLPWLWCNLKKYQHDHFAYGLEQTTLSAGKGSFYAVFLKTFGVSLLGAVVLSVAVGVLAVALAGDLGTGGPRSDPMLGFMLGVVVLVLGLLTLQLLPRPYFTSRMQNLLWSHTTSHGVRFASALRFWPFFGLTLKNWLLMVLTLGLYWPFARVAMARMRLEAVHLLTTVDMDTLTDRERASQDEAAGEAAGDLFGLDIGL